MSGKQTAEPCLGEYGGRHGGVDFYFSGTADAVMREAIIAEVLAQPVEERIFKQNNRRLIYRDTADRFVIKKYLMPTLSKQMVRRSYGWTECIVHKQLAGLGVELPEIFGFFECRRWGLTRLNGIVLDYFPQSRGLDSSEAHLALPILRELFRKGIYLTDFMQRNILIDKCGTLKLIDVEGAQVVAPCALPQLIFSLTRYIEETDFKNDPAAVREFLNTAYDIIKPSDISGEQLVSAVEFMCTRHHSRAERKSGLLPAEVLKILALN